MQTFAIVHLKENIAPFPIGMHCMSHGIYLNVHTLCNLSNVHKIEGPCMFFTTTLNFLKRYHELANAVKVSISLKTYPRKTTMYEKLEKTKLVFIIMVHWYLL